MAAKGYTVEPMEAPDIHGHDILVAPARNKGPFCDDLLIEVLCRLPLKIMVRCCCVSKGWYELIFGYCVPKVTPFLGCDISVETFAKKMIRRVLLPDSKVVAQAIFAWPTFVRYEVFRTYLGSGDFLLDSCNGLMLFQHPSEYKYVLWNPKTQQLLVIPCPRRKRSFLSLLAVDAGVVRILSFPKDGVVDVLCLHYYSWTEVRKVKYNRPVDNNTFSVDTTAVYLHGKLFRLGRPRLLLWYTISDDNDYVICDYVKLPGGDDREKENRGGCIGSCMGRLQYAEKVNSLKSIGMWMFNADTSEWILKHSVSLQALARHPRIVGLREEFPTENEEFRVLNFNPGSDEGAIIWTPRLIFYYYYKSGDLISLRFEGYDCRLESPPHATFPITPSVTPLALPRITRRTFPFKP
ncbi:hypothetical protein F3Y22_tig00110320pilonHSYRG00044 [Hibiscus syriacus]|uniref:F-box domain-containing protein n=1 Tax=Hibiscus syriacus TaxID=106335 RepID=A0A6A3B1K9_HIBSY|nr:hypothetical protein F3Y22_tig00110320pilonHSYRG00044 [Hibiscus syriacus]